MLQFEINSFYLKSLLYIPTSHPFNPARLVFFFLVALPSARETYQYLIDPRCKRYIHTCMAHLGKQIWHACVDGNCKRGYGTAGYCKVLQG